MIAKRTTTTTTEFWVQVTFTPDEADQVRRMLGSARVLDADPSVDRLRVQFYNSLGEALASSPHGDNPEEAA
jgi:hypothetical protein